jgi:hypothetical protein
MRAIIIIAGYLGGAIAGTLLLVMTIALTGESPFEHLDTLFRIIFPAALVFGAPVALAVIVFSEWYKKSDWQTFASAGVVVASLIALLLFGDFHLVAFVAIAVASILAAMTYWVIAWKLFPPKNKDRTFE